MNSPGINPYELDEFTTAYITCMLWCESDQTNDQGGDPLERNYCFEDIAQEALKAIVEDCKRFQEENEDDIDQIPDQYCKGDSHGRSFYTGIECAGHDFWFTRNGHGVGFWDRDYDQGVMARLSEASRQFGECVPYVGDDNKIYLF